MELRKELKGTHNNLKKIISEGLRFERHLEDKKGSDYIYSNQNSFESHINAYLDDKATLENFLRPRFKVFTHFFYALLEHVDKSISPRDAIDVIRYHTQQTFNELKAESRNPSKYDEESLDKLLSFVPEEINDAEIEEARKKVQECVESREASLK